MKKILAHGVEVLLIGGLLWAGHYALAAVALYLAVSVLLLGRQVNHLRALVRVLGVSIQAKTMGIADAVGAYPEAIDRRSLEIEADQESWESLKADADLIGLTLATVAEERERRFPADPSVQESLDYLGRKWDIDPPK